jgi:hypothetical protein
MAQSLSTIATYAQRHSRACRKEHAGMMGNSQALALDISDRFTLRTMERERRAILYAIKSFRTLDVMVDQDDLWQEAWIGVNNAHHTWDDARAINMQFRNFLIWHVKRHLQGLYLSSDKVVDLIDPVTQRCVITLSYARYCKQGRQMARERRYHTRIRSLKVYYEHERDQDQAVKEVIAITMHSSTYIADIANPKDTHVVDIYNRDGTLIVTIPMRTFQQKQTLIENQGLMARQWCIYDHRPAFDGNAITAPAPTQPKSHNSHQSIVVDIYTRKGDILLRTTPERYKNARDEFEQHGCLVRYHDPIEFPTQPDFREIEERQPTIKSLRQVRHLINT